MNNTQNLTLPQAQLSAVARPVDTFVAPAQTWRSEGDGLMEAAKALQELNPKLQAWFQQEKQDQEEAATDYGYNLNKNRESFNGYMKRLEQEDPDKFEQIKGLNPHVQRGFNQAFLEGKAMNYSMALSRDLANNPMVAEKDEATGAERQISVFAAKDPAAIQTWLTDHRQKWAGENGLNDIDQRDLKEFFNPKATAMEMQVVTKRATEWQNQFYDKLGEQVQQNAIQGITAVYQGTDMSNPEEVSTSAKAAGLLMSRALNTARDHGYTEMGKLGNALIKAVTAMAEDTRNPQMLDALNHVETSPGSYLGKTAAGQDAIAQTRFNIEKRNHTEEGWRRDTIRWNQWLKVELPWAEEQRTWSRTQHTREKIENDLKDNVRTVKSYLINEVMADPSKNWENDPLFKKLATANDSAAKDVLSFADTWMGLRDGAKSDDKDYLTSLVRDMQTQGSEFDETKITDGFSRKLITKSTMMQLTDDARRRREENTDPWYGRSDFKILASTLRTAVSRDQEGMEPGSGVANAGEAEADFMWSIRAWREDPKNQGKGYSQFIDYARERRRDLLKLYNPSAAAETKAETWKTEPVFRSQEDLSSALAEYNQNQGQGGLVANYARLAGVSPRDFLIAQQALLKGRSSTPRAATPPQDAVDRLLREPTPERVKQFEEAFPGQKAETYLKLIRGQSGWERFWDTDLYGNAVR